VQLPALAHISADANAATSADAAANANAATDADASAPTIAAANVDAPTDADANPAADVATAHFATPLLSAWGPGLLVVLARAAATRVVDNLRQRGAAVLSAAQLDYRRIQAGVPSTRGVDGALAQGLLHRPRSHFSPRQL
jgi:hypothetical protein